MTSIIEVGVLCVMHEYHVPLHSRKDLGLVPRPHPQRKENSMVTFMTLGCFLGLAGSISKKSRRKIQAVWQRVNEVKQLKERKANKAK